MHPLAFWRRLPGYVATSLILLTTTLWTFWGVGEMYYEGWWGAWYNRLPYLGLPAICMAFTLVALTWPRLGGWMIFVAGGAFTAWRWSRQAQLGALSLEWMLGWFPISGLLVVVGLLFLLEGRFRRLRRAAGWAPPERWLRRNLRYVIFVIPPVLTAVALTAFFIPFLLARSDDGGRSLQRIEGNGVTLLWAPQGPGWNWHPLSGRGRYPSWDDLALYGAPPVGIHQERKGRVGGAHATADDMETTGLCRYLAGDGTTLMPEPQDIWRLPTADEVVRSLIGSGGNAGCTWDGVSSRANCDRQPNKDAPLWAADQSPIYYWTADDHDGGAAWCVPYTGGLRYGGTIHGQPKDWGNSRHGYRCVRAPYSTLPGSREPTPLPPHSQDIRTGTPIRLAGISKWGIIAALQNDQTGEVGTDMKITTERLEDCQINVFVELDAADVDKELRQTARKLSRNYNIPGYRRGRAPFHAVIRIFGREAVQQAALEEFGQDLYDNALEEIEYEPYEAGELKDVEWDPFRMTILLPIEPEADLGDYRAVRVPFEPEPVTDEDIDQRLSEIQQENGQWVPVERPAEVGDQVVVDMEGTADDELIMSNQDHEMILEAGATIPLPDFHEEIVGMSAGEEKTFTLTVPEDDDLEELADEEATVTVRLHTVREEDLPALDDDLAMMVGDYDSLDELRAAIREEMETAALQQAEAEYLDKVLDAMIEGAVKIEYPPQAVEREASLMLGQMERNLAMSGLQLDTYLGMIGKTRDGYREELRPAAEDRLQRRLVLEQIAELEELEADPDELEAEIDRFSEMAGEEAGEMREMLESEEGRQSVASDLVMTLAQEHVVQIGKGEIEEEEEVEAEAETEEEAEAEVEAEEEEPTGEAKAGEAG